MSDGPKHVSYFLQKYLERLAQEQKKKDENGKGIKR